MKTFGRLLLILRPQAGWLALGILLAFIATAAGVVLMAVSGWFLTAMGLAGVAGVSMNYFTPAAIIRGCAMLRTGGRYAERVVTHEATFHVLTHMRSWMYRILEPLAPAALQGYHSGEVFTRLRVDIDRLERFYLQFVVPVVVGLSLIFVVGMYVTSYSLSLALWLGGLLLLAGLVSPLLFMVAGLARERREVAQTSALRTQTATVLHSLAEAQVYSHTETQQSLASLSNTLTHTQTQASVQLAWSQHLLPFASMVGVVGVLWLALSVQLTGAGLPLLCLLVMATFEGIGLLPAAFASLPSTLLSARRLFDLADTSVPAAGTQPLTKAETFAFQNVHFSYSPQQPPVLQGLNLTLQTGRKIAVMGPSGAGKSSLTALLNGFWAPTAGTLLVNNQPLDNFCPQDVRMQVATAPQNPHIFAATLRENLTLGQPDISQQAIEQACTHACLHDFIAQLPEGYETYVGENGMRLSGGQRQRLSIARALLKSAPFLVLDEPLEGLDTKTGRELLQNVLTHYADRGLLLLTHQKTALNQMDEVWVLEKGAVTPLNP